MATTKRAPSVIWMRPSRGQRGPAPSRDRDAIVKTAIEIADREGIAAVSMRRIAAEIGASASSLYRYFARKDDLLNLMVDGALEGGDVRSTGDWRRDLRAMGHAMRALFKRHPWLGTTLAGRPTLGPNRLRSLESVLAHLAATGHSAVDRLTFIDTLTSFVRGFVASEVASGAAIRESGLSADEWSADQAAYLDAIRAGGAYPRSAELFDELREHDDAHEAGFDAGLEIVLDGIALRIDPKRRHR